ncbi:MAG: MBL fold metallo-hydrolase [Anaerolineae bacterium]
MFTIINLGTLPQNKFWGETALVRTDISATCTLLEVGGHRLLVDPSPHPDRLETALFERSGLRPDAIDSVFVTHFHGDHRYGLGLFDDALWLMAEAGLEEWREKSPHESAIIDRFEAAEAHLPEGVELLPAPGHTPGLHVLRTRTPWGPLIIAGDAVMSREYFDAEEGYMNSVDFEQAANTIRRIKRQATLVIPGHDNLILNLPQDAGSPSSIYDVVSWRALEPCY